MKKMKQVFSIAMVFALMAVSVTGCGGSTGSTGGDGGDTGSLEDTFYIGGIGPTTGAAAIYGSCEMNAAQIAVDGFTDRKSVV